LQHRTVGASNDGAGRAARCRTHEPHSPLVARLRGFGTTIFSEMTALAIEHDAVNLGQGFPDQDPPDEVVAAAHAALDAGHHQYAPGPGSRCCGRRSPRISALLRPRYDPDDEVTVTFGATEAMAATILALCETDDEVVVLEPTYDAYSAVDRDGRGDGASRRR
jgi:N-succinyldiaminopimelate aminotransferase